MPYPGQVAGKSGHYDIMRNPDIAGFLGRCEEVPRPSAGDLADLFKTAATPGDYRNEGLPDTVLALDGSSYEAIPDGRYPSRLIGYLKISLVGLDMSRYSGLRRKGVPYIDPLEVNSIKSDVEAFAMALPSAYVIPRGCGTSRQGFRQEVLNYLTSESTKLKGRSLYDTMIYLCDIVGDLSESGSKINVTCDNEECVDENGRRTKVSIPVIGGKAACSNCGEACFATDVLRCHETFLDTGSNIQAVNRLMNAIEHIMIAHYILYVWHENRNILSNMCFISDGPLAIFGEAASFHRGMMRLIAEVREDLASYNLPEPIILGLTKTGRLVEHFQMISHIITEQCPNGVIFPVSDEYRYTYIEPTKDITKNHGSETYYGQDFYIKTKKGHDFIVGLPYPTNSKGSGFQSLKSQSNNYSVLPRALRVIEEFESDLYGDSLVPVTLAHQHASISLKPGGKVLDIMSRKSLP